jgi:GNAT superfamily N-acetyltransferase
LRHQDLTGSAPATGSVRTLRQQEELPLLRDHLMRLDPESRHDRFNGFLDDGFIERYAAKCAGDGTVIIVYIENGVVRGAAELHPPDQSPDALPEIAFSVEACARRLGVGSILFTKLIAEARLKGYQALRRAKSGNAGARRQVWRGPDIPSRRIHRKHRFKAAKPRTTCKVRHRNTGRCGAGDDKLQQDVLETASEDLWLGAAGVVRSSCRGSDDPR